MERFLKQDLDDLGAKLVPIGEYWVSSAWAKISRLGGVKDFDKHFWITIGKRICYQTAVANPWDRKWEPEIRHEMIHVKQQSFTVVACWLFNYLTSQRFRWRMEREAYLVNIKAGQCDAQGVAELLHDAYKINDPSVEKMADWFRKYAA
jgi:hypothetical protein